MRRAIGSRSARLWSLPLALLLGVLIVPGVSRLSSVVSQPAVPETKAPAAGKAEKAKTEEEAPIEVIRIDLVEYVQPVYTMTGNVHLRQKDTDLFCDRAVYNEDDETARATGNLKLVSPDATVTGDLIVANFDTKLADITGNVRLEAQRKKKAEPAPASEEAKTEAAPATDEPKSGTEGEPKASRFDEYREKLTVVTCERIQYWWEEKRAVATGNVVAVQEDKTVTADEAVWVKNDTEETLTLTGNPVRLVMENGNRMETSKVIIDLKTEVVRTAGPASGIFKREKKEEKTEGTPSETPAPPPSQPPAPKTE